jgi:hypothetical protein
MCHAGVTSVRTRYDHPARDRHAPAEAPERTPILEEDGPQGLAHPPVLLLGRLSLLFVLPAHGLGSITLTGHTHPGLAVKRDTLRRFAGDIRYTGCDRSDGSNRIKPVSTFSPYPTPPDRWAWRSALAQTSPNSGGRCPCTMWDPQTTGMPDRPQRNPRHSLSRQPISSCRDRRS